MKTKYFLPSILVVCFMFTSELFAQNYTPPSRERVENLLEELQNCKELLKEGENSLKYMEANPNEYTLADYMSAKDFIANAQSCINSRRAQLEELRKDYPGWFNNPGASITVNVHGIRSISPRELEQMFESINNKIAAALSRLGKLPKPER